MGNVQSCIYSWKFTNPLPALGVLSVCLDGGGGVGQ